MLANRGFLLRLVARSLLVTLLLGGTLPAQDSASTSNGDVESQVSEFPDQDSQTSESARKPTRSVIYVPFDRFSDVFDNQDASVVVPYAEYLKLWTTQDSATAGGVVDAVITRAKYVADVEQDVARVRAELTVNVIGKPWVAVPLNFGDVAIGSVSSESGDVLLRGQEEGSYSLLFKQRGEQTVTLELSTKVVTSPEGRQVEFDCPPAAITSFELHVPEPDQEIEIHPRLVQEPVDSAEDATRVTADLGATRHIAATWHPRATAKPQMQLLASVTNRQRFHLADGLVHTDAWLTYEVLRGELRKLRIAVPSEQRILDVTATTKVQGWQAESTDDRQILTVELLSAVDDQVTVEVHTEQKLDERSISLGGLEEGGPTWGVHAMDVVRESGQVVVSSDSDLSVRVTDHAGIVRIEPDEVAAEIRQDDALAYKYYSPGFTLNVDVAPVEPRVRVARIVDVVIGEDELEAFSTFNYTIERAGLFELRIALPDGLIIDDVQSEHLQEFRVTDGVLVVLLRERTLGNVSLVIEAHRPLEDAASEVTLPIPEPQDVERNTGIVRLFADDAVEVSTNEDGLEAARPAPAPPNEARGRARLRAAWQFTHSPVAIPIAMTRKPTRLSASVATDIDVEPTRTRVTTLVDFNVEYAGLDRFRISIPEEAIDTLQIESVATTPTSPALKEQIAGDATDGWVPYTLIMQRDVIGRQRFRVIYDLDPAADVVTVADAEMSEDDPASAEPDTADDTQAEEPAPSGNDADAGEESTPSEADPAAPSPESESESESEAEAEAEASEAATAAADESGSQTGSGADDNTNDAVATDVARQRTVIRIIRPLGIEASDDTAATPVSQVTGEIRIQKEQSLTITADATGADVEPIDVRELATLPTDGTFAFRYRRHPADETIAVDVTQARYDVQDVVETVVSRALVEVVLGEDLTATYRCRYRLKSAERQRLRVDLPKGLEILSVLVDGNEVRLEPDPEASAGELWDTYFVKVARSEASDQAFTLMFQFLWIVNPEPFDHWLQGQIQLPIPRLGDPAAAAVQQTRVVVWVPEEYALIGDPDGFTLLGTTWWEDAFLGRPMPTSRAVDDQSWIGGSKNVLLEFPTGERVPYRYSNLGGHLERDPSIRLLWWNTVWYTVVVSVTIALIALLLLRTSWENKLGVLLLLAFGGLLLGLKGEHVLAHAFSVARFGLLFLLGLWLIEAIFGRQLRTSHSRSASLPPMKNAVPAHAAVVPPPGVFEHHLSDKPHGHEKW